MMPYVLAFLNAVVLDVIYAYYIRRTAEGRWWQAGMFAAGTILSGGWNIVMFAGNPWLMVPAGAGALLATTTTVWLDQRKKPPLT